MSLHNIRRELLILALVALAIAGLFWFCGCVTITHRVVFPQLPDRPTTRPTTQPTRYLDQWRELQQ